MPDELTRLGLDGLTLVADLAAAPTGVPIGTAAGLAFKLVAGVATRVEQRKAAKALEHLIEEWARVGELPHAEAAKRTAELTKHGEPQADSILYACFKHMAFSRCGSSWPYIARLTAEYLHLGKPTDSYFRRCGWLLERSEKSDVELMEKVAAELGGALELVDPISQQVVPLASVVLKASLAGGYENHALSLIPTYGNGDKKVGGGAMKLKGGVEVSDFYSLLQESRMCYDQRGQLVFRIEWGVLSRLIELFRVGGSAQFSG